MADPSSETGTDSKRANWYEHDTRSCHGESNAASQSVMTREEFEALGIPWQERGHRTTEHIYVLREL